MPYNTDTMIFDEVTGQYILTEQALINKGTFMRERMAKTRCPSPEYVINGILEDVSDMVYNYIHDFNDDNDRQDYIIANLNSARYIIERAMIKQAEYVIAEGNLYLSVDDNERSKAFSNQAHKILSRTIKEIGTSILYTGV
jgi:hypothetical protein